MQKWQLSKLPLRARVSESSSSLPPNSEKFVILGDCVPAMQQLVNQTENPHHMALLFKKSYLKILQQNKELVLQWIPSHCKIAGNEKTDLLAKAATKEPTAV